MKKLVQKGLEIYNKYKSGILYLFFGGLSTLLNIILFFILTSLLDINYQISNVIAWIAVVIFAYVTNKIWVFESKTKNKKDLLRETVSFLAARLITLGIEFVLLFLFIEKFLMIEIVAKIIINIIVIILNYIFSKVFIFNIKKKNKLKISKKNIIEIIVILIISFIIISQAVYKYEQQEAGYTTSYAYIYGTNKDYKYKLGKKSLSLRPNDIITTKIQIHHDNAKYLYIFMNGLGYDERKCTYNIELYDNFNNKILEEEFNMYHVVEEKVKINLPKIDEGTYTLKIKYTGKIETNLNPTYNENFPGSNFYINQQYTNGMLDVVVFYEKENKLLMPIIISLIILTVFVITYLIVKNKKNKPLEKIFLIIAIPIYLLYSITIPPNAGHDEIPHWYRIFEITEGNFISKINDGKTGSYLPEKTNLSVEWIEYFKYETLSFENNYVDYSKKAFIDNTTVSVYSPIQYLPHVIGVSASKALTSNLLHMYYIGRIFNMIACIGLLYLAIKKIPYRKKILFVLAFIPIAIEGFTTLSGDGFLISVVYYFIAYILNIRDKKIALTKKDYTILILLGIVISLSKIVYVPILGLLFMIPKEGIFKNNKDKLTKLLLIILPLLIINLIWLKIVNPLLQTYTLGKAEEQLQYILSNPFNYLQIFIASIDKEGIDLILQAFGKYMLWQEVIENGTFIPLALIITTLILLFNENNKKEKRENILLMLGITLLVVGLIFTSLYIQWTYYADSTVKGLQGRYFLPILPIILILIGNCVNIKNKLKEETLNKILIYTILITNYYCIMQIVVYFL